MSIQEEATSQAQPGFRKSEMVAALIHLYYMRDDSFSPEAMPRGLIAEMLGVSRFSIMRYLRHAERGLEEEKRAKALARAIDKRLTLYDEEKAKRKEEMKAQRAQRKITSKPKERRKRAGADDLRFKTKGKRNRNMSLRALRSSVVSQGGK